MSTVAETSHLAAAIPPGLSVLPPTEVERISVGDRVIPPGIDEIILNNAFDAVAQAIGEENVSRNHEYGGLEGPNGELWYGDHYEMRASGRNTPAGAFRPKTVEEIQDILKIANKFHIPLWVISRGKNLG
jgi:hypothetical protein